jgi:hypothetical protein
VNINTPDPEADKFYQEEFEKELQDEMVKMINLKIPTLIDAQFRDSLIWERKILTLDQLIDEYGHLLTKEEVDKIRNYINKKP